ncbi:MAG: TetR/AcrR family transcriptional regulator [Pasteurellaceae bacterium]|nr:TetR/AcrR family transcriptional regulator [Pasteurellaceae bacterium]
MIDEQKMPLNEVALRILNAADELMATIGVQNLSTHKIAKHAGVSVGTIYLYFKDKETLLTCLVTYLFERFHQHLEQHYDERLPAFEQYQALWKATWQFLEQNPNVVTNLYQYESLPSYSKLLSTYMNSESLACNKFLQGGQKNGVFANLDQELIFAISLRTVWEIIRLRRVLGKEYSQTVLDEIIQRTWKAITD